MIPFGFVWFAAGNLPALRFQTALNLDAGQKCDIARAGFGSYARGAVTEVRQIIFRKPVVAGVDGSRRGAERAVIDVDVLHIVDAVHSCIALAALQVAGVALECVVLTATKRTAAVDIAAVVPAAYKLAAQVGQVKGSSAVACAVGCADGGKQGGISGAGYRRAVGFELASGGVLAAEIGNNAGRRRPFCFVVDNLHGAGGCQFVAVVEIDGVALLNIRTDIPADI